LDTLTTMKYLPGCLALFLWASPALAQLSAAPARLTAAQATQIDQIRQGSRQRIQALFSAEQRQTYAGLRTRGVSASQAIEMIDLDERRRVQLRQILRESGSAIVKVLGQS
jgi:hypothetical protein